MRVHFKGINKLRKRMGEIQAMEAVQEVVSEHTKELENKMKREASFTQGYSKGTTKRSIDFEITDGGLTGIVQPHTHYSVYVEYGTRNMSAQPFIKPAFNYQKLKFIQDMEQLFR